MGGMSAIILKRGNCSKDLYYLTDYNSHLGTKFGGMAVCEDREIKRVIKDISGNSFQSKLEESVSRLKGNKGIGVISDYEEQPLFLNSKLGKFSIVTVGRISNLDYLAEEVRKYGGFSEEPPEGSIVNPTELVARIIELEGDYASGIQRVQESIEGSCSMMVLTPEGIYLGRDRLGRTPIVYGEREKDGAIAASSETCGFPNLRIFEDGKSSDGFDIIRYLGPGEIVKIYEEGIEELKPLGKDMQICSFLWVYYGNPASHYENINVEEVRYRCGGVLARKDDVEIDTVAGVPDSGTAHGLGYANENGIHFQRPFIKYTDSYARSFMPQDQGVRDLIARMKLIPIKELIAGRRLLFTEDSIVRGTQLQDNVERLFRAGAKEVHMRPACPPLVRGCKYLNFSRSRSVFDLASRRAIREMGGTEGTLHEFDEGTEKYEEMVRRIRDKLRLTSLKFQRLPDLVEAIGLPKEKLCTFCWDGDEGLGCPSCEVCK